MSEPTRTPTRADYLARRCTHAEYYGAIVADAPVTFKPDFLNRVQRALGAGDEPLNTIPLREWDRMAGATFARPNGYCTAEVDRAFRERGDYPTLAGLVCRLKEAARLTAAAGAH